MEKILPSLAKGFLTFSHGIILAPLLIIGFVTKGGFFVKSPSREGVILWGNTCLLVFITLIFNVFLKSLFLVPLNPALGIKGFAFPSGHMQVSVVFYGALFQACPYSLLRKVLLIVLTGIGYGLVQQGYHTLADVGGAVGFGVITLYAFSKVTSLPFIQENRVRLVFFLIPLVALMMGGVEMRIGAHLPREVTKHPK